MNIIDIVIILFILMCMVSGLKRGFIKETVDVVGNIIMLILSFSLMGNVAEYLYQFMPFLNLGLLGITLSALNILVYQIISFAIIYFILNIIFRVILNITKVVDKLINSLLIFHTTSSILGAVVGLISGYLFVFVILVIVSIPLASNSYLHESKLNNFILTKTPILTGLTTNISSATSDIYELTEAISKDKDKLKNSNKYNLKVLDIMLKYNIVSIDTVDDLVEKDKLSDIKNINSVLKKYR